MATTPDPRDVTFLRGAEAQPIGRKFWFIAGVVLCVVLAVVVTVSFISATNDNARIDRLKTHGVSVTVTVTNCVGNIGGSGSNAAGYTCQGEYRINGVRYHEVIGSKTSMSDPGSKVRGVVDPARPSTIELASAVASSSASPSVYLVPGLLTLLLAGFVLILIRNKTY